MLGCGETQPVHSLALALSPDDNLVVVSAGETHQVIAGFGASSAWTTQSLTDDEADLFFSRDLGLGLSLLRLRITPSGTTWENGAAAKAHRRGVAVWAAPWSPPGIWKTNDSDTDGGSLLVEHYQDWADRLAEFARTKQTEGIPLVGISAQNEPDWVADWETCEWTPEQMVTFIRDYLGPALEEAAPGTPVIAPEVANWDSLPLFADPLLADQKAASAVGVVAVHSYGGEPFAYTAPHDAGLQFWETEVSYHNGDGLESALYTATRIHDHLTLANVNAFHYWWLKSDDDTSLMRSGVLAPQAYALGHFSKFVRPGYVRVEAESEAPNPEVLISAYLGTDEDRLVLVAINNGDGSEQSFRVDGADPITIIPWLTTENVTLRKQPRQVVKNPFSFHLPASSITTLVVNIEPKTLGAGGASTTGEGGAAGSEPGDSDVSSSGGGSGGGGSSSPPRTSDTGHGSDTASDSTASSGGSRNGTTNGADILEDPKRGPYACLCSAPGRSSAPRAPLWMMLVGITLAAWRRRGVAS